MELFLMVLGLGLLGTMVVYSKKNQTSTVSIKPVATKEVETQITDAVTVVAIEEVIPIEVVEAPKKRGRKPKIAAATKKPVKGKKQVAPKPVRGRKKKS